MTNDRLSNIALLSIESLRAEKIDLECFVDDFDSRHNNSRIKLNKSLVEITSDSLGTTNNICKIG